MSDKLISQIRIKNLFGLYSYQLPEQAAFSNAAILYGDNGMGKSTVLRLAFHLLSAANDKGHRTALYKAQFESLEVDLTSGYGLGAKFIENGGPRILSLSIKEKNETLVIWDYVPRTEMKGIRIDEGEIFLDLDEAGAPIFRKRIKQKKSEEPARFRGEIQYLEKLKEIAPTMYILNADRRLDSDAVSDPSDEVELRRVMHYEDSKKINDLVTRSREIALNQALGAASRWIGRKAVQSANRGTENVHSVYTNVLKHLVGASSVATANSDSPDISKLLKQLTNIESRTGEIARYELATPLSTVDFRKALNARSRSKQTLAANLLTPYIESLDGRLNAIDPIYKLIDLFISKVNSLLSDKMIHFKLSQGFSFINRMGSSLEPGHLSSGEQQLLLLLCYVLVARDTPSVFMIDEPEISLNIKWQRQLIQTLLDIISDSRIQFIFASHSMELLAQHRSRVVTLSNKK